jgi:hypothetical protein
VGVEQSVPGASPGGGVIRHPFPAVEQFPGRDEIEASVRKEVEEASRELESLIAEHRRLESDLDSLGRTVVIERTLGLDQLSMEETLRASVARHVDPRRERHGSRRRVLVRLALQVGGGMAVALLAYVARGAIGL